MGTPTSDGPQTQELSWPTPPEGGWTADDLDRLPNLPPHTELIDASLVFATPQSVFHSRAVGFFGWQLESAAPEDLEIVVRFTIDIDRQNRPEPDVVVAHGEAIEDSDQTRLPAELVVLVVEAVSTDTMTRDRETKPVKYARAKIPHYWRVEDNEGKAVVYVFELEPATGAYTSTGIFHDRMKVSVPFPVDLDLNGIAARRKRTQEQ